MENGLMLLLHGSIDTMRAIEHNIEIAQARQRDLENRAARRQNFPNLEGWGVSQNRNPYIVHRQKVITIFNKKDRQGNFTGGYGVTIAREGERNGNPIFLPEGYGAQYGTVNEAKLGAFDFLFPRIIRFDD